MKRSFAWLIKNRHLVRDFEQRADVAETLIRIAATASGLPDVRGAYQTLFQKSKAYMKCVPEPIFTLRMLIDRDQTTPQTSILRL